MIVWVLILLPVLLPFVASVTEDPAPGITRTRDDARNMECRRLGEATAHAAYPGSIAEPAPRDTVPMTPVSVAAPPKVRRRPAHLR